MFFSLSLSPSLSCSFSSIPDVPFGFFVFFFYVFLTAVNVCCYDVLYHLTLSISITRAHNDGTAGAATSVQKNARGSQTFSLFRSKNIPASAAPRSPGSACFAARTVPVPFLVCSVFLVSGFGRRFLVRLWRISRFSVKTSETQSNLTNSRLLTVRPSSH